MKKLTLWESTYDDENWLIETSEIEVMVYTDGMYEISGAEISDIPRLNELYRNSDDEVIDFLCEICEVDGEFSGRNFKAYNMEGLVSPSEMVIFDMDSGEFYNLAADCESVDVYRHWDGSNWIYKDMNDESAGVTELTVSEESISVDEWDGSNHTTGGLGQHARIYRVLGEEGKFLLNTWSQWTGSHEEGKIMDLHDIGLYLSHLGRDLEEYLPFLGAEDNE